MLSVQRIYMDLDFLYMKVINPLLEQDFLALLLQVLEYEKNMPLVIMNDSEHHDQLLHKEILLLIYHN